ncbi:hypothetical protein B4U80_01780 [Leptotrombidium deliense]|uniref:Secernin-2-like protein n=1 Tax=Leptotrombidium deliense TaxID=299467 RepID=A0A443SRL5_9ACAR|nr:hypothetical protein B4U80_01780 [Leptotrombidium deliense]
MYFESCDTFVVFPPQTENNKVIFGKNSDRRAGEVQEVVYIPRTKYDTKSKVECTFIEVDQVSQTNAVILSKPSWMWGAEMGANEHGVVVGNEAVFTKVKEDDDGQERLLGMDLLRLSLERANSAEHAVNVITDLLETYGQGGPCEERVDAIEYHNSFLIADVNEAWILETAGRLWAAERVVSGFRNISNCLSIETKIDAKCENLLDQAKRRGLWDGTQPFNFSQVFTEEVER